MEKIGGLTVHRAQGGVRTNMGLSHANVRMVAALLAVLVGGGNVGAAFYQCSVPAADSGSCPDALSHSAVAEVGQRHARARAHERTSTRPQRYKHPGHARRRRPGCGAWYEPTTNSSSL